MAFLTSYSFLKVSPQPIINLERHRIEDTKPLFMMAGLRASCLGEDKSHSFSSMVIRVLLLVSRGNNASGKQFCSNNHSNNAAFQTEDLDTYDSDCDDISNAKAVLFGTFQLWFLVVILRDNEIHSDRNIIPYSQYLQETQLENVQDTNLQAHQDSMILSVIKQSSHEKMIDSQMDDMIKEKIALIEQVDSLEQNLSKQIKENECLFQTFNVFKSKSKEKEDKYMENEIDLEKKIKELDNILLKWRQFAQNSAHVK
ncbi:hypothetical protein Tco_0213841 [Tanacetum coccineum]